MSIANLLNIETERISFKLERLLLGVHPRVHQAVGRQAGENTEVELAGAQPSRQVDGAERDDAVHQLRSKRLQFG